MADERRDADRQRESEASSDERDLGWGGRDWDQETEDDRDLERLIADRPPHHEERER
jgi:hypothetical protein